MRRNIKDAPALLCREFVWCRAATLRAALLSARAVRGKDDAVTRHAKMCSYAQSAYLCCRYVTPRYFAITVMPHADVAAMPPLRKRGARLPPTRHDAAATSLFLRAAPCRYADDADVTPRCCYGR